MQERTNPNIPPHHIIIRAKIPKHIRPHDAIAAVDVSEIAQRHGKQVPLCDAPLARHGGADDGKRAQQQVDVADGVCEDNGAGGDGGEGRGGELRGYEGAGVGAGGVPAGDAERVGGLV